MGVSIRDVKFELNAVYRAYAEQLSLAGNISSFLHSHANISASGGQVEGSVRLLLQNLLPNRITVSQGHIVDKNTAISNQQDVLITDGIYSKSLIKSLDGTEFFPIESIFATGEVKKTWSHKELETTIKSIRRTKTELHRKEISPSQIETGSKFVTLSSPVTSNPIRNLFFCFSFSLDYGNQYSENKIKEIYNDPDNFEALPNIMVVLKRGIFVLVDKDKLRHGKVDIKLYPEVHKNNKDNCCWVQLKLQPEENLAYLIFLLTQHINDTVLEKVSIIEYAQSMIQISQSTISPL